MGSNWKFGVVGLVAFLVGITLSAAWVSAHGGGASLIHSCVSNKGGGLRVVVPDASCTKNESALDWNIQGPSVIAFSSGHEKIGLGGVNFFHPVGHGHVGAVASPASAFTTKVVVPNRGMINNLVAEVNFTPSQPRVAFYQVSVAVSPPGADFHLGTNIMCKIYSDQNTCTDTVNSWVFAEGQGVVINFVPLTAAAPTAEATASVGFTPSR